jgi:hypothetical protein
MATFTRTNPTAVARGTIQRNTAQSVYKVVLNGSGLAVAATDAAAAKISDALGSITGTFQFKSNGLEIYMIVDRVNTSIGDVATKIAQVLQTEGGVFTVSGGVATLSDTNTITVTEPTDLEGL